MDSMRYVHAMKAAHHRGWCRALGAASRFLLALLCLADDPATRDENEDDTIAVSLSALSDLLGASRRTIMDWRDRCLSMGVIERAARATGRSHTVYKIRLDLLLNGAPLSSKNCTPKGGKNCTSTRRGEKIAPLRGAKTAPQTGKNCTSTAPIHYINPSPIVREIDRGEGIPSETHTQVEADRVAVVGGPAENGDTLTPETALNVTIPDDDDLDAVGRAVADLIEYHRRYNPSYPLAPQIDPRFEAAVADVLDAGGSVEDMQRVIDEVNVRLREQGRGAARQVTPYIGELRALAATLRADSDRGGDESGSQGAKFAWSREVLQYQERKAAARSTSSRTRRSQHQDKRMDTFERVREVTLAGSSDPRALVRRLEREGLLDTVLRDMRGEEWPDREPGKLLSLIILTAQRAGWLGWEDFDRSKSALVTALRARERERERERLGETAPVSPSASTDDEQPSPEEVRRFISEITSKLGSSGRSEPARRTVRELSDEEKRAVREEIERVTGRRIGEEDAYAG